MRRVEQRERSGRRGGRLADAALAAEEDVACCWEIFGERSGFRVFGFALRLPAGVDAFTGASFFRQHTPPATTYSSAPAAGFVEVALFVAARLDDHRRGFSRVHLR